MSETEGTIVDFVEIVADGPNDDGEQQFRVRAMSSNGKKIWTTEQYGNRAWAEQVAKDSGKPLKESEGE